MDKQSYEQLSKFEHRSTEIEMFFSERKSFGEKDDNTPWLITLADLLTILLVFSFVIIGISSKSGLDFQNIQTQKDTIGSLVSVAEATVSHNSALLSIPLSMYNTAHPKVEQRDEDEKIIMKNSFYISDDCSSLNDGQKSELHQIAQVCRKNPSTKIIVAADIDPPSQSAVRHAKDIITYLTVTCGINKRNVFMQALTDVVGSSSCTMASPPITGQLIEVKLLKDFWSL